MSAPAKPERNSPCPCGSGLKYKKCHGSPVVLQTELVVKPANLRAHLQPDQLFAQALEHHRAGEFESARVIYQELRDVYPNNADVVHNLGLIALHVGDHSAADRLLRHAHALAPHRLDLQAGMGSAWVALQYFEEAVMVLEPLLGKGLDPQGQYNLAIALSRIGRSRRAIEILSPLCERGRAERWVSLGNIYTDIRNFAGASAAYNAAIEFRSDDSSAIANKLLMLQYDWGKSHGQLLEVHEELGQVQDGIWRELKLPFVNYPDAERRIRIGFVSGDFGSHPVGYMVYPILKHLDRRRFEVFLYASRPRADEMQARISALDLNWVPVHHLRDDQFLSRVRSDQIDVLIDLSGYTAGNRLPVFARRAAPVQLTYLGYPTTTGLKTIDIRLSDDCIDPPGSLSGTENCIRLPGGHFRYSPPEVCPPVSPPPILRTGKPTFGVFGNFSKFSPISMRSWAKVLREIPDSRLVLKAAAFAEEEVRKEVEKFFSAEGISFERLVFLPWTDYLQHLQAYSQVDIMLDTIPFNLAGNTCEALWMGVPVLSVVGDRPAGRMGLSILTSAGLSEWACADTGSMVLRACDLLRNPHTLAQRRASQREYLLASALMDGEGMAAAMAHVIETAWGKWCGQADCVIGRTLKVLHVGCGHPESGKLPPGFDPRLWREVRVDLDPQTEPDFVASVDDLGPVGDESVDAVYSSHNIEHLLPSQVPKAMAEFFRVLKPKGLVMITLPDLTSAARAILREELHAPLYNSPAGVVTAHDLIYSYGPFVESGNPFMLHKTGFTAGSLGQVLNKAGFERVSVSSHNHSLWAVGHKPVIAGNQR
jgi:protein O-GlcNAc transferase